MTTEEEDIIFVQLDEEIAAAWLELLDARDDAQRSPNADSLRTEQYAEMRINKLLDRRYAAMKVSA